LLATGVTGVRSPGGEIFSNVKAGTVYPLFVELKHSLEPPENLEPNHVRLARLEDLKHGLCQIVADCEADRPTLE
jgi:hypothetical protein